MLMHNNQTRYCLHIVVHPDATKQPSSEAIHYMLIFIQKPYLARLKGML